MDHLFINYNINKTKFPRKMKLSGEKKLIGGIIPFCCFLFF